MCDQFCQAAYELETASRTAHEAGEGAAPPPVKQAVHDAITKLEVAIQQFKAYIHSIGL